MSHLISRPHIIDIAKLKPLAHRSKGKIKKLYLHWTAGRYEQVFDEYHISKRNNSDNPSGATRQLPY